MSVIGQQWTTIKQSQTELCDALEAIYANPNIASLNRVNAIIDLQLARFERIEGDLARAQPNPQHVSDFQGFVANVNAAHAKMIETKQAMSELFEVHPASNTFVEEKKQEVEVEEKKQQETPPPPPPPPPMGEDVAVMHNLLGTLANGRQQHEQMMALVAEAATTPEEAAVGALCATQAALLSQQVTLQSLLEQLHRMQAVFGSSS